MAGLVATCGRCLLLLLVLCTPDTATLSLPFQTRDLLPVGPHPGGGHTRSGYPPETDFLMSSSSSSRAVSSSLRALSRLALARRLREGRQYFGGGAGGGGGRWANRQARGYINGIKRKRQGKDRGGSTPAYPSIPCFNPLSPTQPLLLLKKMYYEYNISLAMMIPFLKCKVFPSMKMPHNF